MGKRISFRFFFVRYLRKTPGIHKMVRIATDQSKTFSPRVIKIANQVSSMALLYRQTIVCECMSMKYCMQFLYLAKFVLWVLEVFLACGWMLRCRPEADRFSGRGRSHEWRALTATGNRA